MKLSHYALAAGLLIPSCGKEASPMTNKVVADVKSLMAFLMENPVPPRVDKSQTPIVLENKKLIGELLKMYPAGTTLKLPNGATGLHITPQNKILISQHNGLRTDFSLSDKNEDGVIDSGWSDNGNYFNFSDWDYDYIPNTVKFEYAGGSVLDVIGGSNSQGGLVEGYDFDEDGKIEELSFPGDEEVVMNQKEGTVTVTRGPIYDEKKIVLIKDNKPISVADFQARVLHALESRISERIDPEMLLNEALKMALEKEPAMK